MLFLKIGNAMCQKINLNGHYKGSNMYIQNPFSSAGKYTLFCVDSILINGTRLLDSFETSAIEVRLDSSKYMLGDLLDIDIYHKKGCKPKVLNNIHVGSISSFIIDAISLD